MPQEVYIAALQQEASVQNDDPNAPPDPGKDLKRNKMGSYLICQGIKEGNAAGKRVQTFSCKIKSEDLM